jgi:hypothetical protein
VNGTAENAMQTRMICCRFVQFENVRGASTALNLAKRRNHRFLCLLRHLRKEVIQPHLPVRLPCYDLVLLTSFTFAAALLAVRQTTSGTPGSDDLTGGVYKTRERIHPIVADMGLLTIPAS